MISNRTSDINLTLAIAALLCLAISGFNLIFYLLLRVGLEDNIFAITKLFVVLSGICLAPVALPARFQNSAIYSIIACATSIVAVFFSHISVDVCVVLFAAISIVGFSKIFKHASGMFRDSIIGLLMLSAFVSLYVSILGLTTGGYSPYATVFSKEFSVIGFLNRDVYFHTALANMLENYGKVSLGLDGLKEFKYHFGVHAWLAALAKIAGEPVISVIPLMVRIILMPLLFFAILISVLDKVRNHRLLLFYVIIVVTIICATDALGMRSQWISESYLFSLSLLFLSLACAPYFLPIDETTQKPLLGIVAFSFIVLMTMMTKSPSGLLLIGLVGYASLRCYSLGWKTLFLGLLLFVALFLFRLYLFTDHMSGVDPLYYTRKYGVVDGVFAPFLPLFLIIFSFRKLFGYKLETHCEEAKQIKMYQILFEAYCVLCAGAFLVPNIFDFSSASGVYILDVARWVGLWILLRALSFPVIALRGIKQGYKYEHLTIIEALRLCYVRLEKKVPLKLGSCVILVFLGVYLVAACIRLVQVAEILANDEMKWNKNIRVEKVVGNRGLLGSKVISVVQQGYGQHVLSKLSEIIISSDFDGKTAIYVPYGSHFWSWPVKCTSDEKDRWNWLSQLHPFYFQAMIGLPLMNAWPYSEASCNAYDFLELGSYEKITSPDAVDDERWICSKAQKKQFDSILILRGSKVEPYFERLNCTSNLK